MEEFDKTNTLIPFDQARYDEGLANLAQTVGLIESQEELIAIGFLDTGQLEQLEQSQAQVQRIVDLMRKQKPKVE